MRMLATETKKANPNEIKLSNAEVKEQDTALLMQRWQVVDSTLSSTREALKEARQEMAFCIRADTPGEQGCGLQTKELRKGRLIHVLHYFP